MYNQSITDNRKCYFENVSLLVTHYNRSESLERLLASFEKQGCVFEEVVVSDDGSRSEHLDYIEKLAERFDFRLIGAKENGGLGANINKGQDGVRTEYTLYVQEDFVALDGCAEHFKNAVLLMEEKPEVDTIRFYSYTGYPILKPIKYGFSEMVFKNWSKGLNKFAYYSDHPHLRRKSFLEKFGRYSEGKNPENTEFDMLISFLQRKGKGLLFDEYKSVFDQVNTSSEPSTMQRKFWRHSNNIFVLTAVQVYRYLKFYSNLFFVSK